MKNAIELLHEDLVLVDVAATDRDDLLKKLALSLYEKGYVKETYADAIIKREKVFPTGLATNGVRVAIPHTDAEHVNTPAILVAKLKEEVEFIEMGSENKTVKVSLVFMLALKNHDDQLDTLSNLMNVFSNEELLTDLYGSTNGKDLLAKLQKIL